MQELQQIAARIRELREICDYSTAEVAEKLKIPEADYIRYETDGHDVPINILFRLAAVMYVVTNGEWCQSDWHKKTSV